MTGVARVCAGVVVSVSPQVSGEEPAPAPSCCLVLRLIDADRALVRDLTTNVDEIVPLSRITGHAADAGSRQDLVMLDSERFDKAKARYEIVKPLLDREPTREEIRDAAKRAHRSEATIYRWMARLRRGSVVTDLVRKPRSDAGAVRLDAAVEQLVQEVIETYWLKREKRTIAATHEEVQRRCWLAGLKAPDMGTLVRRLDRVDRHEAARRRGGQTAARKLELIQGTMPYAEEGPYAVIQIDHTKLDLQLVDSTRQITLGRPWITVAIDVYSRMVAGYYVSFDPPGALATGICLGNAILSKSTLMSALGVSYDYPCMGVPKRVQCDNAKEFHGKMLDRACRQYGIDLLFRPVKNPQYGAHIERYLGTLGEKLHPVPGTTYSHTRDKVDYDSEGRAIMTMSGLQHWLAHEILGRYHHGAHSGLGKRSPISVFRRAITGDGAELAGGVVNVVTDSNRLRLDLLPFFKATVQQYGIRHDSITYHSDVLRKWVGARDPKKKSEGRKFLCRYDPRDIHSIYFFDPDAEDYFRIGHRTPIDAPASAWEWRALRKANRLEAKASVNHEVVFRAMDAKRTIEEEAAYEKRSARSKEAVRRLRRRESPQPEPLVARDLPGTDAPGSRSGGEDDDDIQPFDVVERF